MFDNVQVYDHGRAPKRRDHGAWHQSQIQPRHAVFWPLHSATKAPVPSAIKDCPYQSIVMPLTSSVPVRLLAKATILAAAWLMVLPMARRIVRRVTRLTANRGIHQKISPHSHRTRGFRKPLIPTNPNTNPPKSSIPNLKSQISRVEREFFLITWALGDMGLTIDPLGSICIDNHH